MRFWFVTGVILIAVSALLYRFAFEKATIKVGLIYSKTGVMATSEIPVALMFKAAIKQINDQGGLLSQKIEIIEYDTDSNPKEFKKGAEALVEAGVISIFGSWTSGSRKAVKEVVEKHHNLLFYPAQYEGLESSENIIYLGLTANQQINPTLFYIQKNYGNNIYLVGSDYIYPRTANHYIEELSKLTKFKVVGQRYIPFYEEAFGDLFADILDKKPDAIVSTINGDTNVAFFTELQKNGIDAQTIPVFSLSLDSSVVAKSHGSSTPDSMVGHYATWGYFNALKNKQENEFSAFLKDYLNEDLVITDGMFSIYLGVKMFEQAVLKGKKASTAAILKNIKRESFHLSGNTYFLDSDTNHLYRHAMIGKINTQNDFDIIWQTPEMVKPHPFPTFKTKQEWREFLSQLITEESLLGTVKTGEHNELAR